MAMSENIGPFYTELLDFIRRDVESRVATLGFDRNSDPELKAFQETLFSALDPKVENRELPFIDIIEKYRYLFAARGPLHLEKKLLETFSVKEAKEYYIPIYRGLPRLYRKEQPSDSHVKKNFTHLPTLKRLAAERAIFRLYEKIEPFANAKVTFFTWVILDGWGDYIAGLESIETLHRKFPELQIGWVVLLPKKLGSPPVPKGVKIHLIPYEKETPISLIHREALEILRTSDLVIQIPTFYPETETLRRSVDAISFSLSPPPKWVSIGEYGYLESSWFHPQTENRSMGLHFLEKGILVKSVPQMTALSFGALQNLEILDWLFKTSTPGPQEIEEYRSGHHFYLAYLTTPIGGAVYLHALLKAHEVDKKAIDICSPDVSWLIRWIEMQTVSNLPVVDMNGIVLELYYQGRKIPLTNAKEGKKIRIFCPSSIISPDDFHLLVQLSGEFVAVRGNQSFSEAVSVNKAFFYDGRHHARYFMKDLLAIAENRIRAHMSTLEVFRGMSKTFLHNIPISQDAWVEESDFQEREPWKQIALKIGAALQDPDCLAGFKKMNSIIVSEHAFNDFLALLVQRELCHRNQPKMFAMEEEAMTPFADGRISLGDAIETLKKRLADGR